MASAASKTWIYTFDDFCTLVNNGRKADLVDGVIYMASPDNTRAGRTFMWLSGLLYDFVEFRDLGTVLGPRIACVLDEHNAPEPDILFVPKRKESEILPGRIRGAPALAVEIVSPDSIERDYRTKRGQYERFGVQEYWIIDEIKQKATFLQRKRDGSFAEAKAQRGIYRSKVVDGFWLRVSWLWADTRPRKAEAFAEIIRGLR